ncbi:MAG TPA: conjugative transposon protein TraN [Parafilimonas sp.]|nr:conjugative transposon protein TraN [Parafilimonas sp.]
MNWKCVFGTVVLFSLFSAGTIAQNVTYSFIPSTNLAITCNKTTNLIFPIAVQSVDRGSKDILVQQPQGTQNIVQVKADKPGFMQTNLSVITVDGSLYTFNVDYALQPSQLNIVVKAGIAVTNDSISQQLIKLTSGKNEAMFNAVAGKIDARKIKHGKRISKDQIQLRVGGIYINNDVIYLRLQLKNNSKISYDIDNIRFHIKDRQKSKRTATQELELTPVYTFNSFDKLPADSSASCIIALPKFTLTDTKYLSVDVLEKNSSRDLHLALKPHHLEAAKIISD